jgi:hypothetical protein
MLAALVAEEIKRMEHEDQCPCLPCSINSLLRDVGRWKHMHGECDCPVCERGIEAITKHGNELERMKAEYEKRLEDADTDDIVIITPERHAQAEEARKLIPVMEAQMAMLVATIAELLEDFHLTLRAAHAAFDAIAGERQEPEAVVVRLQPRHDFSIN